MLNFIEISVIRSQNWKNLENQVLYKDNLLFLHNKLYCPYCVISQEFNWSFNTFLTRQKNTTQNLWLKCKFIKKAILIWLFCFVYSFYSGDICTTFTNHSTWDKLTSNPWSFIMSQKQNLIKSNIILLW